MAIYKKDIVDVNLNTGSIHRSFLNHTIGHKDDDADAFGVRVFRDGDPVNIEGTSCQAVFMAPDGTNIALTSYGTIRGNEAYVTLPQACYNMEGQFCLAIKIIGGGVTSTVRIVDGIVEKTGATGAVAPVESVPTYQEILAVYEQMLEAKEGSVRFDITQELTTEEMAKARENIDVPSVDDLEDVQEYAEGLNDLIEEHGADIEKKSDELITRSSGYVHEINANKYISRLLWGYGFIYEGVIYDHDVDNQSRYTPALHLLKAGTVIKNNYTGTSRSDLYAWEYSADGTYLDVNIKIEKGDSYLIAQDIYFRLSLEIDSEDANIVFDPNRYITIETLSEGDIFGIEKIEQIRGGYLNNQGELVTQYPGNYYTDFAECEKGDTFVLKCNSQNVNLPIMCKYDVEKEFTHVILHGNLTLKWYTVIVSEPGYVRFSSIGTSNPLLAYKIPASKNTNIGHNPPVIKIPGSEEVNGFYDSTGGIDSGSVSNWHSKTIKVACNAGEVFHYYGNNGYNAIGALFYNNDVVIGSYNQSSSSMGYETKEITIPDGCNLVMFQSTNVVTSPVYLNVYNETSIQCNNRLAGKKWCAIGDSITAGDGNNGRSYVEMISEETGIIGYNKGYGGSGYYNGAGGSNQFYNRITGDTTLYDVYTIMGSVNDGSVTIGEITDTGTSTLGGCMNATIQSIYTQNPAARIAIISPSTAGGHFAQSGFWKEYIDFQKAFCAYNAIPYLDLNVCDNLRPWDDDFNDAYFYHNPYTQDPDHGDRTHPNEEGYKFFTGQIIEFLNSVVK